MKLLVDTHALIWWLRDDPKLGANSRRALDDAQTIVYVSAASAWEIAIKHALGKLPIGDDLAEQLAQAGFIELPISIADGLTAGALPRIHADPFDRMIIAQAQRLGLTVVTDDAKIDRYDIDVMRALE